jgi:two-component system, OmpR family, osmolarity sensor histidine kinase EnvZ
MAPGWVRKFLPKSINGRAALILLLPILTLQMVVSVAFVQRYYEGISRQMTSNLFSEIDFFLKTADQAPNGTEAQRELAALSANLNVSVSIEPDKIPNRRGLFDLSGRAVENTLRNEYQALQGIDFLENPRSVQFSIGTSIGNLTFSIPKYKLAAPNRHQLLVVTFFTGILMAAISLQFLRNQMNPIRRLAQAAEAFGKGQIVPFQVGGASEIRSAGAAFLDMRDRIERQKEQRTLMLTGVSHDLRTPLTRLKLSLSMLESADDIEATTADVAEMEGLIDSFLDYARTESTESTESTEATEPTEPLALADASDLVRQAVRKIDPDGKLVGFGDMSTAPDRVELRASAIERAVANLVGNAVRYANTAKVSVKYADRTLRLIVEDDGPGISSEDRDRAMKPFVRLDPARNQNKGSGVGLGLAIVSDIAVSHGGRLVLGDSQGLGGLRAEFAIPV